MTGNLLIILGWCSMKGNRVVKKMLDKAIKEIHTSLPAKIVSIDKQSLKADVKPLIKVKHGDEDVELPIIQEVPVCTIKAGGFIIKPPYQEGDIVLLLFSERCIDDFIYTGENTTTEAKRRHSLEDAVIIGGLNTFTSGDELPDEESENLVIGKNDYSSKITIKEDGDIVIEADSNIYLNDSESEEGVPLGNTLKNWIDEHTHDFDYSWTDSGGSSSGTTKVPNSNSPDPSNTVKVGE